MSHGAAAKCEPAACEANFEVGAKEPDVSGQLALSSVICIACSLETHKAVAKSIASLRGV